MKGNCAECSRRWVCDIDPNECDEFPDPLPLTNADRIRSSDEEVATMLLAVKHGYTPWCACHCENEGDDGCDNCIKKWLQQPCEGD